MLSRTVCRALRPQSSLQQCGRRGLASPASGSFAYTSGESSGLKFASRDLSGPTTTLALVSKAGTRYETAPGLCIGLEKFAYRNTERRSALRIVRETELLGGELFSYHSRENLVVGAKFLRDDLPYFVELLAEVASQTRYLPHVVHEEVLPLIGFEQKRHLASTMDMAWDSAHGMAFHRGLGNSVQPTSSTYKKYLDAESIEEYGRSAYAKSNSAIVANGAEHSELSKWVGEFFTDVQSSGQKLDSPQTKYYGGEERIAHGSGNSMVLAFPGSSSYTGGYYKPEIAVLASLLGGQSSIKWSPGFSLLSKAIAKHPNASADTKSAIYSDAGLLAISLTGSAKDVAGAAHEAVKTIKGIAGGEINKEDIKKAVAHAKFKELEFGQNIWAGLELTGAGLVQGGKAYQLDETAKQIDSVTEEQVKKAAKQLLDYKASVSAVGDLYILPYAEELGLKV